jgi:hypothetical protein
MTLELHKPVRYGYQILLAALLQECGLSFLLVLPSLDTLVDVFVVFEKVDDRSLPDSFFVVKLLTREPLILGALRISLD